MAAFSYLLQRSGYLATIPKKVSDHPTEKLGVGIDGVIARSGDPGLGLCGWTVHPDLRFGTTPSTPHRRSLPASTDLMDDAAVSYEPNLIGTKHATTPKLGFDQFCDHDISCDAVMPSAGNRRCEQ